MSEVPLRLLLMSEAPLRLLLMSETPLRLFLMSEVLVCISRRKKVTSGGAS